MTIISDFGYIKPKTVAEAIKAMSSGKRVSVLAGGTDLVCRLHGDLVDPELLVDIKDIDELKGISASDGAITIGALVTFSELIESKVIREKFPVIIEASRLVASGGVRNRATMVGNICSAVPSCDSAPPLLVYEAEAVTCGPSGERNIPISKWFTGPKKTALGAGEIVKSISIPIVNGAQGGCYVRLGRCNGEDLAQASVAILALQDRTYRVAFGAVSATPVRALKIEALLKGKTLDDALIKECQKLVSNEISPISDIRSTKEYREEMVKVMLGRGLRSAAARFIGKEPSLCENLI